MIDDLSNEDLKDPVKLRLVIKDLQKEVNALINEIENLDGLLTDDEKGLKETVRNLITDVGTINKKIDGILESQKDTRKTIKNTVLSGSITTIVTAIVGFVLKQLGFF